MVKPEERGISMGWLQAETEAGSFSETDVAIARLPLKSNSLEALRMWGFTDDELHRIVGPRRTLARRKQFNQPLSAIEADRVRRLQRVAQHADRVFANHDKAARWLRSKIIALDGEKPIDLLQSESGAHFVEQILHRIDYGMFS
jgi:putative toxin-antitoxin system antitoxin component (TIGR02293 family)